MTWSALTATADQLRAGNEDILSAEEYSDNALQELYRDAAKAEMLLDVQGVIGSTDSSVIDEITNENQPFLQSALSHKQLAIFYRRQDAGDGTATRRRMDYYERLYRSDVVGFGRLVRSNGATVSSTMIRR